MISFIAFFFPPKILDLVLEKCQKTQTNCIKESLLSQAKEPRKGQTSRTEILLIITTSTLAIYHWRKKKKKTASLFLSMKPDKKPGLPCPSSVNEASFHTTFNVMSAGVKLAVKTPTLHGSNSVTFFSFRHDVIRGLLK